MYNIPIEKLVDKTGGSLLRLVILASRRALELSEGMPKLVDAEPNTKATVIALREIFEGKVRCSKD